jgi:hypothetical protein
MKICSVIKFLTADSYFTIMPGPVWKRKFCHRNEHKTAPNEEGGLAPPPQIFVKIFFYPIVHGAARWLNCRQRP